VAAVNRAVMRTVISTARGDKPVSRPDVRNALELCSGGRNVPFMVESFGGYVPAAFAFELVHGQLATCWMRFDASKFCWLTAFQAGVVHKDV
jgi:hypothetical protein